MRKPQLWRLFEATGCPAAYLIYTRNSAQKARKKDNHGER